MPRLGYNILDLKRDLITVTLCSMRFVLDELITFLLGIKEPLAMHSKQNTRSLLRR